MKRKQCGALFIVIAMILVITPMMVFAAGATETSEADLYSTFPSKPVTIIVSFAAGGGTDVIFRAVASVIEKYWGQPLVIVNRPGAGGTVGASSAANARADGYTLFAALQGPIILNPLQLEVDYTAADFDHIVQLVSNPMPFVGRIDNDFQDAVDLVSFALENPGAVNLGTTGIGNLPHLMTLRLQQLTGAEFNIVPMQGNAPALRETLAGNIEGYMDTVITAIKEGSVRGLGILSEKRHRDIPDVPTFGELGFPEMIADVWFGVSVPAGVPEPIQQKIADTMEQVANDSEFKAMMSNLGNDIVFLNREEFGAKMDSLARFFPGFLADIGMLAD